MTNRFALLATLLYLCVPCICAEGGQTEDGLIYQVTNDQVIVTGYQGTSSNITIPESIETLPVTQIAYQAFKGSIISGVLIPASVTNIGAYAFWNCYNLTNSSIPEGVTSILEHTFRNCYALTEVNLPNSLKSIGRFSFWNSGLTNLNIPDSVITLDDGAYKDCSYLASIHFGSGLTNLQAWILNELSRLESITVSESNAFYSGIDGLLYDKAIGTIIQYPRAKEGDCILPASVTNSTYRSFRDSSGLTGISMPNLTVIADQMFYGCSNLTNIVISDSITRIGSQSFLGCRGLTNLSISAFVLDIGYQAFRETGIPSFTVDDNNPYYSSEEGVLYNKDKTLLIQCPPKMAGDLIVPSTVTNIEGYAFFSCSNLTSVVIEAPLTVIATRLFHSCSGLTNISIPGSVTSIEDTAFYGCTSLTTIEMPSFVTNIGLSAFNSSGLTNFTIPDGVTKLESNTFWGCSALETLVVPAGVTNVSKGAFAADGVRIYFMGNAPIFDPYAFSYFSGSALPHWLYYLPGTTGWEIHPDAQLWLPVMLLDVNSSPIDDSFSFTVSWANGKSVVFDACTDLSDPVWMEIGRYTFTNSNPYTFLDSEWSEYSGRYYRIREE